MTRTWLRVLLTVILWTTSVLADTKTCELNQDGTCVEEEPKNTSSSSSSSKCNDDNAKCAEWAGKGECEENPGFMLRNCKQSCNICNEKRSVETLIQEIMRKKNEGKEYDINETPFGVQQEVTKGGAEGEKTQEIIDAAEKYVREIVKVDPKYDTVRAECKNRHPHCAFWAAIGECEANPKYMVLQCAPSCQTCDKIDFDARCPWDKNAQSIFEPGDLDKMFERITTDPFYQKYEPVIHSQPPKGPWLITLEKFATDDECERLIELGAEEGYDVSKDVGKKKFDGTYEGYENKGRTSTNAWCKGVCYNDTLTQQVLTRMVNVTGVPDANSEYLQLLKYEVGQFYNTHNDYIPHQVNREEGVRVLTMFMYLNEVEAGGGTNFPRLDLTVMPKRGKAVLWPSVLNDRPDEKDRRTNHQALPVEKGIKYGANAWLHQRDFKSPYDRGCL